MDIKIINPILYPDWNRQVSELPGTTIFHTANWAKVLSKTYGYTPTYFCMSNNGKIESIVPVMEINSLLTGKRGVSLPFSDQVEPIIKEKRNFEALLKKMVNFGKSKRWETISFHGGGDIFDASLSSDTYMSFDIETYRDQMQLFDNLRSNTRRNIRKADKSGVVAKVSNTWKGLKEFYRLNCISRKKFGLPPQPYSFFENIYEYIIKEKLGFICLGYYKNLIISGVVFFHFNNNAIYKYGASERQYLHLRPNNKVFWEALKESIALGVRSVNLGRTELNHEGLIRFKKGWNCSAFQLNYFKINIFSEQFIKTKSKIKSSYKALSYLPIPVLRSMGNLIYKHFG